MIDRCPHCRERVFFTGSTCPSCGKDRDATDTAPAENGEKPPAAEPPPPGKAAFWGALALAVLAVWSFAADWALVSQSGSIDYRNRVTGLRLLADGEELLGICLLLGICFLREALKEPLGRTGGRGKGGCSWFDLLWRRMPPAPCTTRANRFFPILRRGAGSTLLHSGEPL